MYLSKTLAKFPYQFIKRLVLWLLLIVLIIWLLYLSLQFAFLKALNVSSEVGFSISDIDLSYENQHLLISLPRLAIDRKDSKDDLAVLQGIELAIALKNLLAEQHSFASIKIADVFVDIDHITQLDFSQDGGDWLHTLAWIKQASVDNISLKFQDNLLALPLVDYQKNKIIENQHLLISLPRLAIDRKDSKDDVAVLQGIELEIAFKDLRAEQHSFASIKIADVFVDIDHITQLDFSQDGGDWLHTLAWIKQASVDNISLKFQDNLLALPLVDYQKNKIIENQHLLISLPRLVIDRKDSKDDLAILQGIELEIAFKDLRAEQHSFASIKIADVFVDVDYITQLDFSQDGGDWFHTLAWVKQASANNISLKFQDNLLAMPRMDYQKNKMIIAPFVYQPNHLNWFSNEVLPVQISTTINFIANTDIKILLGLSNEDITAKAVLDITKDQQKITGLLTHFDSTKVPQYLPDKLMSDALQSWMRQAFKKGIVPEVRLDWIRHKTKPAILEINADFAAFDLSFHPRWPLLENVTGTLKSDGDYIDISINNARLSSLTILKADVNIVDMNEATPILSAKIDAYNGGAELLDFLKIKPIEKDIPSLDFLRLLGDSKTTVGLSVPLLNIPEGEEPQVTLTILNQFVNNELWLPFSKTPIKKLNAQLRVVDDYLQIDGTAFYEDLAFNLTIKEKNQHLDLYFYDSEKKLNLSTDYIKDWQQLQWKVHFESTPTVLNADLSTDFLQNSFDIYINFARFNTADTDQDASINLTPQDIPKVNLKGNNIFIDNYALATTTLQLSPKKSQLDLTGKIILKTGLVVDLAGVWQNQQTQLQLNTQGDYLHQLLATFDSDDVVDKGSFAAKVDLSCTCRPWQLSLNNITGTANIDIEAGVLKKQDASLGRILSLLNIKAFSKRLSLDASDALSKGFSYDKINASATFAGGKLDIKSFNLSSLASQIQLSGKINLVNQQLDLTAKVVPSISDSVPLVSYLSGGGLAGLGLWLVDKAAFDGKILDNLLNSTTAFDYKVGGSWQKPEIQ